MAGRKEKQGEQQAHSPGRIALGYEYGINVLPALEWRAFAPSLHRLPEKAFEVDADKGGTQAIA